MNPNRLLPQYLLRFDDLCPTMGMAAWIRFESLVEEFRLSPILGIVPCNSDPELAREAEDADFWEKMRRLQKMGATIGLHGCRHLCTRTGKSLLPLHRHSEFSGAPLLRQQAWIREGLSALRAEQLQPRIWVAPRHGFDATTLQVLREEGIELLSDGLTQRPVLRNGMIWIPQQLWEPRRKSSGVWTICIHPATASDEFVKRLRRFLQQNLSEFTSVSKLLNERPASEMRFKEEWAEKLKILRIRMRWLLHSRQRYREPCCQRDGRGCAANSET